MTDQKELLIELSRIIDALLAAGMPGPELAQILEDIIEEVSPYAEQRDE